MNIFRVMLIGAMLITLLTLMNHPLFEWSWRPKLTALNNNFALIIKVIGGTIQIFHNNLSFLQEITGTAPDAETGLNISKASQSLVNLLKKQKH